MKSILTKLVALCLIAALLCTGCSLFGGTTLNGTDISQYTIVYSQSAPDYCQRAAAYIQGQILSRTGIEVPVCEAASGTYPHEILVGETDRALSAQLDADTQNVEFAITSDGNHVALEGDYFIIAAAAYYFVETYIPGEHFESTVPAEVSIHTPITQPAKNIVFLIGDGMGFNHTKLFEAFDLPDALTDPEMETDGEDVFYGYYLPYQGSVLTGSLSGTTDSAAGATALACGYKTINSYVGLDSEKNPVMSLTELAMSMNMATAVMSTDHLTGATPAGFSAHTDDRDKSNEISRDQLQYVKDGGVLLCGLNSDFDYQTTLTDTLALLENDPDGFFMMYEEGHIDKWAHKMNVPEIFTCVVRFNQVIGLCMEHAFYNPDTLVLITADHETGGLTLDENGDPVCRTDGHTPAEVPIFAYGQGAEVFDDYFDENNLIPMELAKLWGVPDFGDQG